MSFNKVYVVNNECHHVVSYGNFLIEGGENPALVTDIAEHSKTKM